MALNEVIDTTNFVVGDLYHKGAIANLGRVKVPESRDWVGIVQFKNCIFLFVKLDKSDAEEDHKYHDMFEDSGSTFIWDSQKKNTQKTTFIHKMIGQEVDIHLFVRVRQKIGNKTQPFCYAGRLLAEDYDGERPVTLVFENRDFRPEPNDELKLVYDWRPDVPMPRRPIELKPSPERKKRAESAKKSRVGGQGRSADAGRNKATELRAMEVACEYYQSLGYVVIDTSANRPYDFECVRNDETRWVEVKGTSGGSEKVNVTEGEVVSARQSEPETDLFIVSGIALEQENGAWQAYGGEAQVVENWYPDEEDLAPTQYRYSVPESLLKIV